MVLADKDSSGEKSFISGTNFAWDKDDDGTLIKSSSPLPNTKLNVKDYSASSSPSARAVSARVANLAKPRPSSQYPDITISLPARLQYLLDTSAPHDIPPNARLDSLVIADTDASEHMFPDKSAFISYHRVSNVWVRMRNDSYAPALGQGSVTICLNRYNILVRDVLHVPSLRSPLYSLRVHHHQRRRGFI